MEDPKITLRYKRGLEKHRLNTPLIKEWNVKDTINMLQSSLLTEVGLWQYCHQHLFHVYQKEPIFAMKF